MASFSFEFRTRVSNPFSSFQLPFNLSPLIGEFFFVVGPTDYNESYKYRITVEPTLGRKGNSVVGDFGIDNNIIELNGEFNLLYQGRPEVVTPTIPLITGSNGLKTGQMEFNDFLGLLYQVKYTSYIPQSIDIAILSSYFSFGNNYFDHSRHILIFNDYDRGKRVEVVPMPDGITISRSVQDNFSYKWKMKLIVVGDESDLFLDIIRNPLNTITTLTNLSKSIINAPLAYTGLLVNLSSLANRALDSIQSVVDSLPLMLQQFNKDGLLIKNNFTGFTDRLDNVLRDYFSVMTLNFDRLAANANIDDSVRGPIDNSDTNYLQNAQTAATNISNLNYETGSALIPRPINMPLEIYAIQPNATSITYIENNNYLSIINLTIAINQIIANMIIASIDVNFYPYLVYSGDTFESIALKQLGDKSLADSLAKYNNIKYLKTGSIIKIPFTRQLQIFSKVLQDGTPKSMEIALLGEDLKVTENRDIAVDLTGDLDIEEGISCYLSNIVDLIETPINSLPVHEWWGNPVEIAEIHNEELLKFYKKKLTEIIKTDSRTLSVTFLSEIYEDDRFYINMEIFSIFNISPIKIKYSPQGNY